MDEFDKEAVEWCKHHRLSVKHNAVPLAQFIRRLCVEKDRRIAELEQGIKDALEEPGYDWRIERMNNMIRILKAALSGQEPEVGP